MSIREMTTKALEHRLVQAWIRGVAVTLPWASVLSILGYHLVGLGMAWRARAVLTALPLQPGWAYLVGLHGAWTLLWGTVLVALARRHPLAARLFFGVGLLYLVWGWVDRLFLRPPNADPWPGWGLAVATAGAVFFLWSEATAYEPFCLGAQHDGKRENSTPA